MRFRTFISATICLFSMSLALQGEARPWRVEQLPNGTVNACANCHVSASGGGSRTSFGQSVGQFVLPGSTSPFWSPNLAAIDSDNDGFSNGQELQDPNGTWSVGQSHPGDRALVTHPGNAASKPAEQPDPDPTSPGDAWVAYLTADNEFNNADSDATGIAIVVLHEPEMVIRYYLQTFDLANVNASHIHLTTTGGVAVPLDAPVDGYSSGMKDVTAQNIADLRAGRFYINVHTSQNPSGEISGLLKDEPVKFKAVLTGDQEVSPVTTAGSGSADLMLDENLRTLSWDVSVMNLQNVTMAHIHVGARGVSGGVVFPIASSAFTTIQGDSGITDEQIEKLLGEQYYVNVHTTQNQSGEIRGQIVFDSDIFSEVGYWELHQ